VVEVNPGSQSTTVISDRKAYLLWDTAPENLGNSKPCLSLYGSCLNNPVEIGAEAALQCGEGFPPTRTSSGSTALKGRGHLQERGHLQFEHQTAIFSAPSAAGRTLSKVKGGRKNESESDQCQNWDAVKKPHFHDSI
jgi:hypothetical protein